VPSHAIPPAPPVHEDASFFFSFKFGGYHLQRLTQAIGTSRQLPHFNFSFFLLLGEAQLRIYPRTTVFS
jgi:hypothetical protein